MNKIFSLSGMPPNSISSSWIYPLCWITFCIYVCMYAVSSKFMCLERTNDVQQIGLFLTRGSRTSNVNLRFSSENANAWTWTNHTRIWLVQAWIRVCLVLGQVAWHALTHGQPSNAQRSALCTECTVCLVRDQDAWHALTHGQPSNMDPTVRIMHLTYVLAYVQVRIYARLVLEYLCKHKNMHAIEFERRYVST